MYYTIYKITNQIDGKFYIGSHKTKNLNDNYMGSGKYLQRAQEKYGIENFKKEILFVFETAEEMYAKELEIVNEDFLATENTYNLKKGGFGGFAYINQNPDKFLTEKRLSSLLPISELQKRWREKYDSDECFRKKIKDNLKKAKIKQMELYPNGSFFGKTHNEETKKKIGQITSKAQKGSGNSQAGTMWICNLVTKENKKVLKGNIPEGWIPGRNKWNKTKLNPKKKSTEKKVKKYLNGYPVSVNGVKYKSISHAADSLGIGHETARMRFKSKNFPEYIILSQ